MRIQPLLLWLVQLEKLDLAIRRFGLLMIVSLLYALRMF